MSKYTIEEITTRRGVREFIDFPKRLYKNNKLWISPLDSDIESRFDPQKNELFEDGEITRFLVRDSEGRVVGRIAAFYNRELVANSDGQPTGGCGYFESIDDQEVANILFDAARDWLKARGMEAMDGPINFGDRNQFWGLLVHGFEFPPIYGINYHFEYYISLFENYGFKNYFEQHSYLRLLKAGLFPDTVYERVKRLQEDPRYEFKHISKKNLNKYAEDFLAVYNKAWVGFAEQKALDREHAYALMNQLKPIIDEKLMFFAYYDGEPIGFFLMIPDLNGIIKPFKGKFGLWQKIRLLWGLKVRKKHTKIMGLIFGVVPDFQRKGIESGMIYAFEREVEKKTVPYDSLELSWIGDFNPLMMRVAEVFVAAKRHKKHVTYRYLFDREKPFTRAPRLGGKKKEDA